MSFGNHDRQRGRAGHGCHGASVRQVQICCCIDDRHMCLALPNQQATANTFTPNPAHQPPLHGGLGPGGPYEPSYPLISQQAGQFMQNDSFSRVSSGRFVFYRKTVANVSICFYCSSLFTLDWPLFICAQPPPSQRGGHPALTHTLAAGLVPYLSPAGRPSWPLSPPFGGPGSAHFGAR